MMMPRQEIVYRRVKWFAKDQLDHYPNLYSFLYGNIFNKNDQYINQKTNLVIDGFPSSGNTFIFEAVDKMTNQDLVISHHMHASSQFIMSDSNANIAKILMIRDPIECACSNFVRQKYSYGKTIIPAKSWLKYWINYHSRLLLGYSFSDTLVLRFDDLKNDQHSVIKKIKSYLEMQNIQVYSKNIVPTEILHAIEEKEKKIKFGKYEIASVPNENKEKLKKIIQNELSRTNLSEHAAKLYHKIMSKNK